MNNDPLVSILIPAYNSEPFIDRTLWFARGQKLGAVKILLSIDAGSDNTHALALRHAREDARLLVQQQHTRLGWAGNVNWLLEQVDTPFFCLYFHDDILLPQYTGHLLHVLEKSPQAAGVYCAMGHFGASDHVSAGPEYHGSPCKRLLTLLLHPERGSPLRALLRTEVAGGIRLPDMGSNGFWANEPFLMQMLLSGPLAYSPEALYLRWNRRSGGLTEGWKRLSTAEVVTGWRANIDARLEIIESATHSASERDALRFALFLHAFAPIAALYEEDGHTGLPQLEAFHPLFADPGTPELLRGCGELIETQGAERYARYLQHRQYA